MKRRHMAHHFHDENGNFGITTFFWDKVFGTYYDRPERPVKSPTVFNLGYTPEVAEVYPYVAELSGGVATGHPRQRGRSRLVAKAIELTVHLAQDPETRLWYVADSQVPGLRLEAASVHELIRMVADVAPELVDLNREEIAASHDKRLAGPEAARPPVAIRPVIDTPLAIAC